MDTKMSPEKAIAFAQSWTKDMKDEGISHQMPIWVMVKTLLDHIERQRKDVESLTYACQALLRANKEMQHELSRSKIPR